MDLTKFVHDAKTADKSADNRVKDTLSALQKNEKSLTRVAAQLNDEVLTKLDAAKFPVHVAYCLCVFLCVCLCVSVCLCVFVHVCVCWAH